MEEPVKMEELAGYGATRRRLLRAGGGLAAFLLLPPTLGRAQAVLDIAMAGTPNGSRVWFDPVGVLVQPGQVVRWVNDDAGNAHTATAYHPDNGGRARRIPAGAAPWDSDYLLPGQSFSVTLTEPGVYDYFCRPHEAAGMVGRIIVGSADPAAAMDDSGVPAAALAAFPTVAAILAAGTVHPAAGGGHAMVMPMVMPGARP